MKLLYKRHSKIAGGMFGTDELRSLWVAVAVVVLCCARCVLQVQYNHGAVDIDNNEFAEFEDVDDIVEHDDDFEQSATEQVTPPSRTDTATNIPSVSFYLHRNR